MTFLEMQNLCISYLNTDEATLTVNDSNLVEIAINNARRTAERAHDFQYAKTSLVFSIASDGSSFSTSTPGIKRVIDVLLPIGGGQMIPIEYLTLDAWNRRLQRQMGRQQYNASQSAAMAGFFSANPVCYLQGQTLFLVPSQQFNFPVSATLSVVQWMPDYVNDSDTDFFLEYAPDYIQWQAILELNNVVKEYVHRIEGNIDEEKIKSYAAAAFQTLLAWDSSVIGSATSTPPSPVPAPAPVSIPAAQDAQAA